MIYKTDKIGLDIGCGHLLHENCIGIDISENSLAEIIHNVEDGIPFADNTFEIIYCENIVEHIRDIFAFFRELSRVAKPGAHIIVKVPHYSSRYAWGDLTHIRPFSYDSFTMYGGIEGMTVTQRRLIYIDAHTPWLAGLLKTILFVPVLGARFFPRVFERFFAYLFGGIDYMHIEFRVDK